MTTNKTGQLVLTSVVIAAIAAASLLAFDVYGKSRRVYLPAGSPADQRVMKLIVDTPGQAFTAWKERGLTGRTVVYVGGTWERLENIYEPPVSRPYPLKLYRLADVLAPGDMNEANILFAAALNRIVRNITVVLPMDELNKVKDRAGRAKDRHFIGKALYFPYQGLPRLFMTSNELKKGEEPVLLYVSASYFRTESPEELYKSLEQAGIETDSVILCRDSDDANVTAAERGKLARFAEIVGIPSGT